MCKTRLRVIKTAGPKGKRDKSKLRRRWKSEHMLQPNIFMGFDLLMSAEAGFPAMSDGVIGAGDASESLKLQSPSSVGINECNTVFDLEHLAGKR